MQKLMYVTIVGVLVAIFAVICVKNRFSIGPVVLVLAFFPAAGLVLARRSIPRAIPDLLFGAVDTGLLTVPALWGGALFGVAGAIAGGVIGDALTDAVAGFFEAGIEEWLRKRGIQATREPVATALAKMAGCLAGGGLVLSVALFLGIEPKFA